MTPFDIEIIQEVVNRLIGGKIEPLGDTEYDRKAYDRQEVTEDLIEYLLDSIIYVYEQRESPEASIQKAGEESKKFLQYIRDYITDVLENR